MSNLYARAVFFVKHAERSLRFYTEQLGFSEDWKYQEGDRTFVCQVSCFGFELILNEVDARTQTHAGHGRVFIGLDDDQAERIRDHFAANSIQPEHVDWGRPTLVVRDVDQNELFFWLPHDDFTGFDTPAPGGSATD
jgi:Glyoxalase/Bleomycin resistance protein/Dioxygenase superfamily.